ATPLREIKCNFIAERDAAVLRGIRTLAKINDLPAATFWMRNPGSVGILPASGRASTTQQPAGKMPALPGQRTTPPTSSPSGLSAKKQIEQFVAKMKELNPQWDGEVKHVAEGNKVVELEFSTVGVESILPVQAMRKLQKLVCTGPLNAAGDPTGTKGQLADLSPLKGLPLENLRCCNNPISDLSPLQGSPLKNLRCQSTLVSDLSPLRAIPLNSLICGGSPVLDLTPLKGMKLSLLRVHATKVTDLTPLAGMPLRTFACSYTAVVDLTPLASMRLEVLGFKFSQVKDITPLKGMPLRELDFNKSKVTDLSVLKGMPLQKLFCDFKPDRDTKLLRSIKTLETINGLPAKEFWKRVDTGEAPQAK
ncbi:MAG: hypothetical protein NTY01_23995, partial [Verrucomicrobia bacterium]|nr:hypothetical protein [Verrucomicrobiota bacterium]